MSKEQSTINNQSSHDPIRDQDLLCRHQI